MAKKKAKNIRLAITTSYDENSFTPKEGFEVTIPCDELDEDARELFERAEELINNSSEKIFYDGLVEDYINQMYMIVVHRKMMLMTYIPFLRTNDKGYALSEKLEEYIQQCTDISQECLYVIRAYERFLGEKFAEDFNLTASDSEEILNELCNMIDHAVDITDRVNDLMEEMSMLPELNIDDDNAGFGPGIHIVH